LPHTVNETTFTTKVTRGELKPLPEQLRQSYSRPRNKLITDLADKPGSRQPNFISEFTKVTPIRLAPQLYKITVACILKLRQRSAHLFDGKSGRSASRNWSLRRTCLRGKLTGGF
jgi:hypothetical protein